MRGLTSDKAQTAKPNGALRIAGRVLLLLVVFAAGLQLGGCTKCDVPDWLHSLSPAGPMSCHEGQPR